MSDKAAKPRKRKTKVEVEVETEDTKAEQGKKKVRKVTVVKAKEPKDWRETLAIITQMRKEGPSAPVDTMGCDVLHDTSIDEKTQRYQILLALMLSSQTKDQVTAAAMKNLREHGATVDNILATPEEKIDALICKVGFHKRKADYIKRTTQILKDQYGSDIPPTAEKLMELPGVGPKMAFLAMNSAWKTCVGIGVDVHVHRISNRLKWVDTKTPEQTRMALESWLPREHWHEINHILVGFGQTVCLPVNPKCADCKVNTLCPTGRSNLRGMRMKGSKKAKKEMLEKVGSEKPASEVTGETDSAVNTEVTEITQIENATTSSAQKEKALAQGTSPRNTRASSTKRSTAKQ